MWEFIGFIASMLVVFFLLALIPHVFDLPDSIAKFFGDRLRRSEIERRLVDLEAQLKDVWTALGKTRPTASPGVPWSTRLDAVNAISDSDQRDETLGQMAEDAATAGEGALVLAAIGGIKDSDSKNEAAAACAVKLAAAGKNAEAIEVAKTISDVDQRDETLSHLARG